jgi:hypothetical protein
MSLLLVCAMVAVSRRLLLLLLLLHGLVLRAVLLLLLFVQMLRVWWLRVAAAAPVLLLQLLLGVLLAPALLLVLLRVPRCLSLTPASSCCCCCCRCCCGVARARCLHLRLPRCCVRAAGRSGWQPRCRCGLVVGVVHAWGGTSDTPRTCTGTQISCCGPGGNGGNSAPALACTPAHPALRLPTHAPVMHAPLRRWVASSRMYCRA